MAIPGAIMGGAALGLWPAPTEMRLADKMDTIGVPMASALGTAILMPVALGKLFIPINHFVLDGALDLLYAHQTMVPPDELQKEVPVVIAPVLFWLIWALG